MSQDSEILLSVTCKVPALVKMKLMEQSDKKGVSFSEYISLILSKSIKDKKKQL